MSSWICRSLEVPEDYLQNEVMNFSLVKVSWMRTLFHCISISLAIHWVSFLNIPCCSKSLARVYYLPQSEVVPIHTPGLRGGSMTKRWRCWTTCMVSKVESSNPTWFTAVRLPLCTLEQGTLFAPCFGGHVKPSVPCTCVQNIRLLLVPVCWGLYNAPFCFAIHRPIYTLFSLPKAWDHPSLVADPQI